MAKPATIPAEATPVNTVSVTGSKDLPAGYIQSFIEGGRTFSGMIVTVPGIGQRFFVLKTDPNFESYTMPVAEAFDHRQLYKDRPITAADTAEFQAWLLTQA